MGHVVKIIITSWTIWQCVISWMVRPFKISWSDCSKFPELSNRLHTYTYIIGDISRTLLWAVARLNTHMKHHLLMHFSQDWMKNIKYTWSRSTLCFPSCKCHIDLSSKPDTLFPSSYAKSFSGSREKIDHIVGYCKVSERDGTQQEQDQYKDLDLFTLKEISPQADNCSGLGLLLNVNM